jgi:hypothetical protein
MKDNSKLFLDQSLKSSRGLKVNLKAGDCFLTTALASGSSLKEEKRNFYILSRGYYRRRVWKKLGRAKKSKGWLSLPEEIYQDALARVGQGENANTSRAKVRFWEVAARGQGVEEWYFVSGAILLVILALGSYLF